MVQNVLMPQFKFFPRAREHDTITLSIEETTSVPLSGVAGVVGETRPYAPGELCQMAKIALENVGGSLYDVTFDHNTGMYTFTSNGQGGGGIFTIDTTVPGNNWFSAFGFSSSRTGLLTYTSSGSTVIVQTITMGTRIRKPRITRREIAQPLQLASAERWAVYRGAREQYRFVLEFESIANAQAAFKMFRDAALFGGSIELLPDSTINQGVDVHVFSESIALSENIYQHYLLTFELVVQRPVQATNDFTIQDLIDRGPL